MASLIVFYVFSPVWVRPIPSAVGFYSLGFIFILAAVSIIRPSLFVPVIKLAGYFLALYYILALDFSANFPALLWYSGDRSFLLAVFVLMAGSYLLFLITAVEKVPMSTMDLLLLALVALTFLLPWPIRAQFHVNTIAVKVLLMFLSLEVVVDKLDDRIDLLALAAFPALAMNLIMALWPWVI